MRNARAKKIVLNGYGDYLGMAKGCFLVKHKDGSAEKYPLFEKEIGEVILKTGNSVSVGALASLGFWEIDTLILTQREVANYFKVTQVSVRNTYFDLLPKLRDMNTVLSEEEIEWLLSFRKKQLERLL